MRDLPWQARSYLVAVVLVGAICLTLSLILHFPGFDSTPWEIAAFIVISPIAGGKKVRLSRGGSEDESVSMSLGFAVTLACLMMCGPGPATAASMVGCLSSCLYPKRQALHQLFFNVALAGIEALVGGVVYAAIRPHDRGAHALWLFLAVSGASLVFFAVNTLGVSTIISLCTRDRVAKVWRANFVWVAPSYLATASIAALAMILFQGSFGALVLFVLPVAFVIYQSYITSVSRAEEKERHIEEMQISQAHLAELYLATIRSLALAIDAKDRYTHQHILRVQRYAVAIAIEMGFTGHDLEAIKTGALLHDIGKLGVPEYVLVKPGRLTDEEFASIKKHPEIGAAILDPVEFPWPVIPIVRHHHEKWDGTGYPDGLKGEDIPLNARIMAVADVYDALTSTRAYRSAWTHEKAVSVIKKDAGTHFDPVVVEAFDRVIHQVVEEMAAEGEGPLAARPEQPEEAATGAAKAVRDISLASTELWALYEVAQSLSSALGTQDTVEFLCRKLEKIFPGALCAILLTDGSSPALKVACAEGVNSAFFHGAATISERSSSRVALDGREVYTGQYDVDDVLIGNPEGATWTNLSTCVIVPIVYQETPLGTINLYHQDEKAFGDHDIHLLKMVAARSAQAVYNCVISERARGESLTDPLTDAFNLGHFTDLVEAKCNRPSDLEGFALVCLDLDSFRAINDNFGHAKGDEVLRGVAKTIAGHIGPADLLARYGGDGFLLLLDGADGAQAVTVAEQLQRAVDCYEAGLNHPTLGRLHLWASAGIASFPEDGHTCAELVSVATNLMSRHQTERRLRNLAGTGGQEMAA